MNKTEQNFSDSIVQAYDAATTYHDGKWLMIELQDERLFADLKKRYYILNASRINNKCEHKNLKDEGGKCLNYVLVEFLRRTMGNNRNGVVGR